MKLAGNKNFKSIADRLYRLYSGQMQNEISAAISYPDPNPLPTDAAQPDEQKTLDRDPAAWKELPALLKQLCRTIRKNKDNPSDFLPAVNPVSNFEDGIETAMLGGKVRWMGSKLHTYGVPAEPLISEYRTFDWALPRDHNVWLQRYLDAYRYFLDHADNDFAIMFDAQMLGLNIAVQLRGTSRAYLDIYEEPDNLEKLLDFSLIFVNFLKNKVEDIIGDHNRNLYAGHPLSQYGIDRQPPCSVDAYSLCPPSTLRNWGRKQFVEFIRSAGGATLHIHENSHQVIEEVTEIPGWRMVTFSDARNYPPSFELRRQLRRRMGDIPIRILCKKEDFITALNAQDLPCNTQYSFSADSLSEAERIMEKVRLYRR